MRFVGGTQRLIAALVEQLASESVRLGTCVTQMSLGSTGVTLTVTESDGAEHTLVAEQVIAAVLPRLPLFTSCSVRSDEMDAFARLLRKAEIPFTTSAQAIIVSPYLALQCRATVRDNGQHLTKGIRGATESGIAPQESTTLVALS